jgi:hypothetical protein
MGLGITVSGSGDGEFLPLLAYNAKAGRLKLTQRVETAAGWETQEKDVSFDKPVFVMDMANVQVGWLLFKKGMAPIKALATIGQPIPACPNGDFGVDAQGKAIRPRQGFLMRVMDAQGTVREFSSNAGAVVGALDALHTAYASAPEAAAGKLPVVQFTGAEEIKSKHGSNYAPVFAITRWVDRPAGLNGAAAPVPPAPGPYVPPANTAPVPTGTIPAAVAAAVGGGAPAVDPLPFAPEWR